MIYLLYALLAVLGVGVLLVAVAAVRTLTIPQKVTEYKLSDDTARVDAYAEKLSAMVQVETISDRADPEVEKFRAFHTLLEELFPTVFANCEKIEIDGNLMLKWKGKSDKDPILLMSHMDVVEATGEWKYPPFSGELAEGKVWGRGAADTKCSLMALDRKSVV